MKRIHFLKILKALTLDVDRVEHNPALVVLEDKPIDSLLERF
jgi:hypothetical protein